MGKIDKEYKLRMEGMIAACAIAERDGVDALKKDIQHRGIVKAPITIPEAKIKEFFETISGNVYYNTLTIAAIVLHDKYKFGSKRLKDFAEYFATYTKSSMDLDYLGEHYVTLDDYAIYLRDELGVDVDVAKVSMCQEIADSHDPNIGRIRLDKAVDILRERKFMAAASYLQNKCGGVAYGDRK
ncbi:MAG: hypothetical protein R3Y58_03475 [Eubacteriales bacterium]